MHVCRRGLTNRGTDMKKVLIAMAAMMLAACSSSDPIDNVNARFAMTSCYEQARTQLQHPSTAKRTWGNFVSTEKVKYTDGTVRWDIFDNLKASNAFGAEYEFAYNCAVIYWPEEGSARVELQAMNEAG